MTELGKVIKGLECCILRDPDDHARCSQCSYGGNCVNRLKMDALSLLKAYEPGWISVKDRLPEEQGTYLVFREEPYGMITIAWYSGPENGWLALDGGFYADGVLTHYMPLPEPPKEGT